MDLNFLEELLYQNESTALDFKQEQYPFERASNDKKGELLKDILSFANSWRRTDAYILIGVQEVKGEKANVIGITQHLDDAALQQFINSKTNKTVEFTYEELSFAKKQIGIIKIPIQERPIFLKQNFGKLLKDTVYFRLGSSTRIAKPDEIAKMGAATVEVKQIPRLDLQFAERDARTLLGKHLHLSTEVLSLPNKRDIPEIDGITSLMNMIDSDYYREFAEYLFYTSLLRPVSFVVINTSEVVATNVRIQITQPKLEKILMLDSSDYPNKPRYSSLASPSVRRVGNVFDEISTDVEDVMDNWEISIKLGSIQASAKAWSYIFYFGASQQYTVDINAAIFADNLPKPLTDKLKLSVTPVERSIDLDELISIADVEAIGDLFFILINIFPKTYYLFKGCFQISGGTHDRPQNLSQMQRHDVTRQDHEAQRIFGRQQISLRLRA